MIGKHDILNNVKIPKEIQINNMRINYYNYLLIESKWRKNVDSVLLLEL